MSLKLFISEIQDRYVRKNFQIIQENSKSSDLFSNFRLFEVVFTKVEPHNRFKHNLGILPKDVIFTSTNGPGTIVSNSSLATAEFLDFSISGSVTPQTPLTVRFLAGTVSQG